MAKTLATNLQNAVRIVAASTTLRLTDFFISVQAPAANVVLTLPKGATVPAGTTFEVVKDATATFTVAITPNAADKLNGGSAGTATTLAAGAGKACDVFWDGTQWWTNPFVAS